MSEWEEYKVRDYGGTWKSKGYKKNGRGCWGDKKVKNIVIVRLIRIRGIGWG